MPFKYLILATVSVLFGTIYEKVDLNFIEISIMNMLEEDYLLIEIAIKLKLKDQHVKNICFALRKKLNVKTNNKLGLLYIKHDLCESLKCRR